MWTFSVAVNFDDFMLPLGLLIGMNLSIWVELLVFSGVAFQQKQCSYHFYASA